MTLRENIKKAMSDFGGLIRAEDGATDEDVNAILSLFKQAIEEAKPKEKEIVKKFYNTSQTDASYEIAYRKSLSDYHSALIKKIEEKV